MSKQILKKLKNDPYLIETIDSKYLSNHKFMLKALEIAPLFSIRFISKELLNNEKFMKKAVSIELPTNLSIIAFSSKKIRNNKDIMLSAIDTDIDNLKYASKEIRSDENLAFKLIKNKKSYFLENATTDIKNNEQIIFEAIKENPWVLQYASKRLRNSKEFVLKAMNESKYIFNNISKKLQLDEDIIYKYLDDVEWLDGYWDYQDHEGRIVSRNKEFRFQDIKNKKVVKRIVKENPVSIIFAAEKFRKDKDIVRNIVDTPYGDELIDLLKSWYPSHEKMYQKILNK